MTTLTNSAAFYNHVPSLTKDLVNDGPNFTAPFVSLWPKAYKLSVNMRSEKTS